MENTVEYVIIFFIVLPMFLMIVVAIFAAILVISDLPFRSRD